MMSPHSDDDGRPPAPLTAALRCVRISPPSFFSRWGCHKICAEATIIANRHSHTHTHKQTHKQRPLDQPLLSSL